MAPRALVLFSFIGTALLAACGGGGGVTPSATPTPAPSASATATPTPKSTATPTPSSTATPTPSGTATPTPSGTATPTPSSAAAFNGGTQTISATSSGGTFTIAPADATYTGSATFGANDATGNFNFTLSWATFAQISGTFAPGALTSTIGTAVLYLDFKPSVNVTFNQTPSVTMTTTGSFPGTHCGFAVYGSPGSGGGSTQAWFSMTQVGLSEVTPSGNSFTIPAATLGGGGTVQFGTDDTYIALYCH